VIVSTARSASLSIVALAKLALAGCETGGIQGALGGTMGRPKTLKVPDFVRSL
jgi:hypothetical protein